MHFGGSILSWTHVSTPTGYPLPAVYQPTTGRLLADYFLCPDIVVIMVDWQRQCQCLVVPGGGFGSLRIVFLAIM
ncbi:GL26910 [Drosophila persimilis]|uniref:GL26910 n=1 Tax=Drosophila persimilis TaxID=7234 RepID=B4H2V1_DROPE|nr:GL26910 [Drosophila persimilis]